MHSGKWWYDAANQNEVGEIASLQPKSKTMCNISPRSVLRSHLAWIQTWPRSMQDPCTWLGSCARTRDPVRVRVICWYHSQPSLKHTIPHACFFPARLRPAVPLMTSRSSTASVNWPRVPPPLCRSSTARTAAGIGIVAGSIPSTPRPAPTWSREAKGWWQASLVQFTHP